jgi:hypothetical protein
MNRNVLLTAAVLAATLAAPRSLVTDDFEEANFPPTARRIVTYNMGGAAEWTRRSEGNNHYAYSDASGGHNASSAAYLYTGYQTIYDNDTVSIHFRGNASTYGDVPTCERGYGIARGNDVYYSQLVGNTGWTDFDHQFGPLPAGTDYDFVWWVYNGGVSSGAGGVAYFSIDDVAITVNSIGVAPASFGRVKALYR